MGTEDFADDVFLSHSTKDKAVVRPLAERLRTDGLKVWFDEWVLKPGEHMPPGSSHPRESNLALHGSIRFGLTTHPSVAG
jgi:hypothetical protein